ncbi:MAG TPA: XdhC family protein [Thermoanaerobaculia bacterium]|nr:XdhC family protein [Thermoanaerobaculia bacterium]
MKHWKETADILARAARLRDAGRRAAMATVVRIEGSAYRRPGAKFLVEDDGRTSGSVSGGCLEADVREAALRALRDGEPRLLHYETGSDDRTVWGLGLGCNGSVDIFVQPAAGGERPDVAERIRELLEGETAFSVSTVVKGSGGVGRALVQGAEGILAGSTGDSGLDGEAVRQGMELLGRRESRLCAAGAAEVFIEVLAPPPHFLLFGAGDDAMPLCSYASDAGFRVTVVDHRAAFLSAERFPGAYRLLEERPGEGSGRIPLGPRSYAVVKTHSFAHDRTWTRALLASNVPYVGLLGPRARAREILRQIGAEASDRVFGPVGLDLGAEGPEQIAISIVAEILAACSAREPWSLREKEGAIHAS